MRAIADAKNEKEAKVFLGKAIAWFIANKKMRLGVVFTLWTSVTTLIAGSGWVKDATSDKTEIIEPQSSNSFFMPQAFAEGEPKSMEIDSTWIIYKLKGRDALLITHRPTKEVVEVSFPIMGKLEERAWEKQQQKER